MVSIAMSAISLILLNIERATLSVYDFCCVLSGRNKLRRFLDFARNDN